MVGSPLFEVQHVAGHVWPCYRDGSRCPFKQRGLGLALTTRNVYLLLRDVYCMLRQCGWNRCKKEIV
uniref:Uncharacterized protein n=1 Tax=Anguilla anguilla TaxID=7936 RepID=A0A0E9VVD7_ANGAN